MRSLRLNKVNLHSQDCIARTEQVWICSLIVSIQSHGEIVKNRSPSPNFTDANASVWVEAQESAFLI